MRAALAAALFVTPDLLLLDEVLCHLDCLYFVVCFSFLG
jgi:ATPase subunit of ABC transporter with duplicated ATPase domains